MRWTDSCKIAKDLAEAYPEIDPLSIQEADLHRSITNLQKESNYVAAFHFCHEQLKSIQRAWIEESTGWHIDI